jgi:8-oxo-dGTP diphosphatase
LSYPPGILARGPWPPERVTSRWQDAPYAPTRELSEAADVAIAELRGRGSPSHDGVGARLRSFEVRGDELHLEIEEARWALRLLDDASDSLTALCVVRSADGRWLAGRRAPWVASWAGRWALGAGGAVEVGENPAETLSRELEEEWQLVPSRLRVEALAKMPSGLVALIGLATVPAGAEPVPDAEHDEFAWWPADVGRWPDDADERLRLLASALSAA